MVASPEDFKKRTKEFALRIIRLLGRLPEKPSARVIANQLLRSGTSVGANYRSACRARSRAEFCAKMGIVVEEADESAYWLELLIEAHLVPEDLLKDLTNEANQIVAMAVASIKTVKRKREDRE